MAKKKHLTAEEMHKIDINSRDTQLRNNSVKQIEYDIALKLKDIEILKRDVVILRQQMAERKSANQVKQSKYLEFIEELKVKYKVTKLGYDPLTGEVYKED